MKFIDKNGTICKLDEAEIEYEVFLLLGVCDSRFASTPMTLSLSQIEMLLQHLQMFVSKYTCQE